MYTTPSNGKKQNTWLFITGRRLTAGTIISIYNPVRQCGGVCLGLIDRWTGSDDFTSVPLRAQLYIIRFVPREKRAHRAQRTSRRVSLLRGGGFNSVWSSSLEVGGGGGRAAAERWFVLSPGLERRRPFPCNPPPPFPSRGATLVPSKFSGTPGSPRGGGARYYQTLNTSRPYFFLIIKTRAPLRPRPQKPQSHVDEEKLSAFRFHVSKPPPPKHRHQATKPRVERVHSGRKSASICARLGF